jgi:hypothetical protein
VVSDTQIYLAAWYFVGYVTFMLMAYDDGVIRVRDLFYFSAWSVLGGLIPIAWLIATIINNWDNEVWRK